MIVLKILLWLLVAVLALPVLLLLLLIPSVGVRVTNRHDKSELWLKYGFLSIKLAPKKPQTDEQKAKAAAKKQLKAEAKKLKAEKKRLKLEQKAERLAAKSKKKKRVVGKSPAIIKEKDVKGIIRSVLAALADYDKEYLKLIYIKKLDVLCFVGGADAEAVGKRYGAASAAFGAVWPVLMRRLRIGRYRVNVRPDFLRRASEVIYDVTVTVRPLKVIYYAIIAFIAYKRNYKIYGAAQPALKKTEIKNGGNNDAR